MAEKDTVIEIHKFVIAHLSTMSRQFVKKYGQEYDTSSALTLALLKEALRLLCFGCDLREPTEIELKRLRDVLYNELDRLHLARVEAN